VSDSEISEVGIDPRIATALERRAMESDCCARHERTNGELARVREKADETYKRQAKHWTRLVSLIGERGDNGKVGAMAKQIEDHEHRLRITDARAIRYGVLLALLTAVSSAVGAALLQRLVGG